MGLKNYIDFSKFDTIVKRFKFLSLYKVISYDFKKERPRNKDIDKLSRSINAFSSFFVSSINDLENNEYEYYKKINGRLKIKNQALYLWGE